MGVYKGRYSQVPLKLQDGSVWRHEVVLLAYVKDFVCVGHILAHSAIDLDFIRANLSYFSHFRRNLVRF
jgi:hypothetical protein